MTGFFTRDRRGRAVLVLGVSVLALGVLYLAPLAAWSPVPVALVRLVRGGLLVVALWVLFERLHPLQIYTKILIGLLLGALAGLAFGSVMAEIKPLGTAFIRLIQMIVVPLVFASLLVGTASLGDPKKMGRIGLKTLVYYLAYTAFAVLLGLALANLLEPGRGLPEEVQSRLAASYGGEAGSRATGAIERASAVETLLRIIPTNPMQALSQSSLLQIIFFAIFSGVALALVPRERAKPVIAFFEGLGDAMIGIVHIVIRLAPYGVFALIAAVVGSFGVDVLLSLLRYALITIAGLLLLNFSYPPVVRLFSGMSPLVFMKGIRSPQLIAFSTSSSSATLPVTIQACEEKLGVPPDIASFVLPLGATVNMNGSALYHGVSAVFIAQVYGIPLTLGDQVMIVLTATLASIGAAGAPGVAVLMLVIVLEQVGIPVEGISLILGVERILDMFRTTVNITGDASAAVVIAASEGELRPPASGE
jgi:Na+/H+-dicarboxylate symporter